MLDHISLRAQAGGMDVTKTVLGVPGSPGPLMAGRLPDEKAQNQDRALSSPVQGSFLAGVDTHCQWHPVSAFRGTTSYSYT